VFELRNDDHDLDESTESDKEMETLVARRYERVRKQDERYSPPNFCSAFVLVATYEEPMSVMDSINSIEGKLWKEAMVEKMESLHKNETWDLV